MMSQRKLLRDRWSGRSRRPRRRPIGAIALLSLALTGCAPERRFDDADVVGLAPGPEDNDRSIVQLYVARSYEPLSRMVSVHSWLALRRAGEVKYTVYEAHRFPPYLSGRAVRTCRKFYPDRKWHGAEPVLLAEVEGGPADNAILEIEDAVRRYPDRYRLWPGPNSNSFIAELARAAPELRVDLPPTAISKDFLVGTRIFAPAPSGTGWQVSILGLVGILLAREEGIEINLLGAVFGVDFDPPALKLPIIGRLGFPEGRRADPAALEKLRQIPPEYRCH
jgi:uncharacterized protein DUF3750